jgi:ATP-dependent helicase/nuclease subunit A
MGKSKKSKPPPDQDQRQKILDELDTTMLVEAAAGTGKTTSMVGRMVALIAEGRCGVDTLAAVTFTRKAAAELRARFQVVLETAARDGTGEQRQRLQEAAAYSERCFIGTIHSFCARLLRERPVEAGVDVAFTEVDEAEDARIRREAWDQYVAGLFAADAPILAELDNVGLEIGQLYGAFDTLAEYPDVQEWPAPEVDMTDLRPVAAALLEYAGHMRELSPTFPTDPGNDKLMPTFRETERAVRLADTTRPAELMTVLEQMASRSPSVIQRNWPGGGKQAKAELERWEAFIAEHGEPKLAVWRQHRYEKVIRAIRPGVEAYDRRRHDLGTLNYQDLLMKAAALLRGWSNVRQYFRRRFTHVLVDEFQDTDPVQAEVMLLLTADDPRQADWHQCRPVPGSLFVVGDPKQSIYRFRRADIVTYNQVRDIIEANGGETVRLWANFRSSEPVIQWVNGVFNKIFPDQSTTYSPANVPLEAGRVEGAKGSLGGVYSILIPAELSRKDEVVAYEADFVARFIRKALDGNSTIARSEKEVEAGATPQATAGDFLIISTMKARLGLYAQCLQRLGIPHQVTGGSALNQVGELALLHRCLKAVCEPDNPVALVAALRSELFGLSDADLYAYKRSGGRFSFRSAVPEGLDEKTTAVFADAFTRLSRYAGWLARLPAAVAIERACADLGLMLLAAAAPGGEVQAGSLAKAIELLRSAQAQMWTVAELVDYLGQLVSLEERYDGVPARPREESPVRVMNLHKAKGLEGAVVFLADPAGESDHPPALHVDRSRDRARGYLAVYGQTVGWAKPPLLAHPPDWSQLAEEEQKFANAEIERLRYVAATRARAALIVSQRQKGNRANPWAFFESDLAGLSTIDDPGLAEAPVMTKERFTHQQAAQAFAEITQRWQTIATNTYATVAAKQLALAGKAAGSAGQEHGTEWGTVIHILLQAVLQEASADLTSLAQTALAEVGLSADLADEALQTVRSQMDSDLWRRAMDSTQRLSEVPFQVLLPADVAEGRPTPAVLRGVIDLAFWEDDGWVVVDHKTDAAAAIDLVKLTDHYRPQVQLYAAAWQQATGQPVKEAGLYFTKAMQYVPC